MFDSDSPLSHMRRKCRIYDRCTLCTVYGAHCYASWKRNEWSPVRILRERHSGPGEEIRSWGTRCHPVPSAMAVSRPGVSRSVHSYKWNVCRSASYVARGTCSLTFIRGVLASVRSKPATGGIESRRSRSLSYGRRQRASCTHTAIYICICICTCCTGA